MVVGDFGIKRIARNLGVMPVDGEEDGGISQDGEVEAIVGVLPKVLAADHHILADGLLESGMKLVAETGVEISRYTRGATEDRIEHGIGAASAGEHEILVEGRLQGARIGDAQHGG